MSPGERAIRKELLRQAQATGMNRREARRWLYGFGWKFSWPTRRAALAQQVGANAIKRREAEETTSLRRCRAGPSAG